MRSCLPMCQEHEASVLRQGKNTRFCYLHKEIHKNGFLMRSCTWNVKSKMKLKSKTGPSTSVSYMPAFHLNLVKMVKVKVTHIKGTNGHKIQYAFSFCFYVCSWCCCFIHLSRVNHTCINFINTGTNFMISATLNHHLQ